jgi:DNA modification methylase
MKPYWQEGKLTIYHGDAGEVLPEIAFDHGHPAIFDLCLTDPPYGIDLEYDGYKDSIGNLLFIVDEVLPTIRRSAIVTLLTPGIKHMYCYPPPTWVLSHVQPNGAFSGPWGFIGWQPILAYGADPHLRENNGRKADSFITYESSPPGLDHPCPKPIALWTWLMKRGAARPADKILDPFLGSGTTLVVAQRLGHEAVGIEQSERYCEVAAKRLRQLVLY